jgi:hypothetical protein
MPGCENYGLTRVLERQIQGYALQVRNLEAEVAALKERVAELERRCAKSFA